MQASNQTTYVDWSKPLFSDDSGVVNTYTDLLPGLYKLGRYNVVTTAVDKNKNKATCTFSFDVTS